MPDREPVVLGFQVKHVSEKHPDGKIVSRVYHARSAAESFAALVRKFAKPGERVFVTERMGIDGA